MLFGAVVCGCGTTGEKASERPVRVAVYVEEGARSVGAFRHLQIATFAENVEGFPVDGAMVREGALDHADVFVVPGGNAGVEATNLGEEGRRRLIDFIRKGGGYIGTCAGAYMLMQTPRPKSNWLRVMPFRDGPAGGSADLIIRYNKEVAGSLGIPYATGCVDYHNGPVMVPGDPVEGADFKVLATYDANLNGNTKPRPTMAGKAAIVVGTLGKGRVFASAVHPEKDLQDHYLLKAALNYVTNGRAKDWTIPHRRPGQLAVGFVCDKSLGVETATFAQKLMRMGAYDVDPMSSGIISEESYRTVDVVVAPPFLEMVKRKGGGRNAAATRAFLQRGGRIVTWGTQAPNYVDFGKGVIVVKNGDEALEVLKELAREPVPAAAPAAQVKKVEKPVRVAFYMDRGGGSYPIAELLEFSPEYELNLVSAEDIRKGVLDHSDVNVQPGGLNNVQYDNLGPEGVCAITNFVRQGGKYYGICAGAYLAMASTPANKKRLDFIPFTHDGERYRGWKTTSIKLTDEARKIFHTASTERTVQYWGGPVMVPSQPIPGSDVKVLATYTANVISTRSPDANMPMTNKAALVAGTVGKGKVFASSPHPEFFDYSMDLVQGIFEYLTGVRPTYNPRMRRRGDFVVGYESAKDTPLARFLVKELMQTPGFYAWDMHDRHVLNDLLHLDVLLVPYPSQKNFSSKTKDFIASGRPVIAVATTPEQIKVCEGVAGVKVVKSFDEVMPLLKQLKAAALRK